MALIVYETIDEALKDLESPEVNDQVRDAVLGYLARSLEFDGKRLERVEAMLAFFLKKQVVEGRQRPTQEEIALLGPHVTNLVTTKSLLTEFEAAWAALKPKGE